MARCTRTAAPELLHRVSRRCAGRDRRSHPFLACGARPRCGSHKGFRSVASVAANINTEALKSSTYPSKIAAGTYSVVRVTGTALTNQSFFLTVARSAGASTNNPPAWRIEGNSSAPIQIYVEDVGGA